MANYYVSVEFRRRGAIGLFEHECVLIDTTNAVAAANIAREILYNDGREHVHVKRVEDSENRSLPMEVCCDRR